MDFRYKRPVITPCQTDKNLVLVNLTDKCANSNEKLFFLLQFLAKGRYRYLYPKEHIIVYADGTHSGNPL